MGDLLSIPDASSQDGPFGDLCPEEAVAMQLSCTRAATMAYPYRIALAFALTRPRLDVCDFSVRAWHKIWAGLAAAGECEGLESPEVFARALVLSRDPHPFWEARQVP